MTFKDKLSKTDQRMTMIMITTPAPVVVQAVAAAGADSVLLDLEHGAVDYADLSGMIAATQGTDCAPLVRIAKLDDAHVKRAMDLGAEGIVFPLIKTAEDADWAVKSLQYPPLGTRSFGPFAAHSRFGLTMPEYAAEFGKRAVCVLLVETLEAAENIDEICAVPGIDLVVPAPFDLSTALGKPGQFDDPEVAGLLTKMEAAALKAGLPLGTIAHDKAAAEAVFARGNRVIGAVDLIWLKMMVAQAQGWCAAP